MGEAVSRDRGNQQVEEAGLDPDSPEGQMHNQNAAYIQFPSSLLVAEPDLCTDPCDCIYGPAHSAPGTKGSYTLPPSPLGPDADAGNQQRGGQSGIVTPTSTVTETGGNAASEGATTARSPTQYGLTSDCNNYAIAKAGDECEAFAAQHSLSPAQLCAWNPVLGLNGANCSTNLWASEYYCIGVRPATTAVCNKYAQAISGDSCDVFASRNSIPNAPLYAWNAVLGSKGENCGTSLWADEWYCVDIALRCLRPQQPHQRPRPGSHQLGLRRWALLQVVTSMQRPRLVTLAAGLLRRMGLLSLSCTHGTRCWESMVRTVPPCLGPTNIIVSALPIESSSAFFSPPPFLKGLNANFFSVIIRPPMADVDLTQYLRGVLLVLSGNICNSLLFSHLRFLQYKSPSPSPFILHKTPGDL
ncbi:hypothetical protein SUNI508_09974 [Seiridium unicorne]|uniref:LysM domain-containing protein n=1 Tax=Seiridium unicorne TaxID=138068 RepID=A0ABR2UMZ9_9PEZI